MEYIECKFVKSNRRQLNPIGVATGAFSLVAPNDMGMLDVDMFLDVKSAKFRIS